MEFLPGWARLVCSSHHCQLCRWRSPIRRASCQEPLLMLTSTRAIGAAPDQAARYPEHELWDAVNGYLDLHDAST